MKSELIIMKMNPMAAPRLTQRSKFVSDSPAKRYSAWRDEIRYRYNRECNIITQWNQLEICFGVKMPISWTERKKSEMRQQPHQQTPDLDNLIKGLTDAVYYNTGQNDSKISAIKAVKVWAYDGYIQVKPMLDFFLDNPGQGCEKEKSLWLVRATDDQMPG